MSGAQEVPLQERVEDSKLNIVRPPGTVTDTTFTALFIHQQQVYTCPKTQMQHKWWKKARVLSYKSSSIKTLIKSLDL